MPSPANMRVGSSPSRLNGKTPAVNGKLPGKFSKPSQLVISPQSLNLGVAILGILSPERLML